jgi:hypothetical protein
MNFESTKQIYDESYARHWILSQLTNKFFIS